jgi:hypothetical protein
LAILAALTGTGLAVTIAAVIALAVSDNVDVGWWVCLGVAVLCGVVAVSLLAFAVAKRRSFRAEAEALSAALSDPDVKMPSEDLARQAMRYYLRAKRNKEFTIAARLDLAVRRRFPDLPHDFLASLEGEAS